MNMKQIAQHGLCIVLALSLFGCTSESESAVFSPGTTFVADPNPIQVCDGSGLGVTTLSWSTEVATQVEVRVGSPSGALLAYMGSKGTAATGKWVVDRGVFYLLDASGGRPPAENILAKVKIVVTNKGCQ